MHLGDNVHGDLTTSNMMIRPRLPACTIFNNHSGPMTAKQIIEESRANGGDLGDLYLIDFGLSFVSHKIEDKAVDIYVLKRALISTHPGSDQIWEEILEAYKQIMVSRQDQKSKGLQIVAKFKDVEMRGRKRECFG